MQFAVRTTMQRCIPLVNVVLQLVVLVDSRRHYPNPHHHHPNQLTSTNSRADLEQQRHHEDAMEKVVVIDADTGIQYNPYSKHHPGRHVCTNEKNVTQPVKTKQAFCKPTYKKYLVKCNGYQLCSGVRLVYETHYKDVVTTRNVNEVTYSCCPGWTQVTNRSHGCNKPMCSKPCLNGGKCVKPDICSCPKTFSGPQCENDLNVSFCFGGCHNDGICTKHGFCKCKLGYEGKNCALDVDECKELKPCDHKCFNIPGSYRCECKEDFLLQSDGQTCRKESEVETTFEAKDLEFELLDKRLLKLETMMDESHKNDVSKNDLQNIYRDMNYISNDLNNVKNKINDVETYKNDMNVFKNKLSVIEEKAEKVDDLVIKYDRMKKCAMYNKICI